MQYRYVRMQGGELGAWALTADDEWMIAIGRWSAAAWVLQLDERSYFVSSCTGTTLVADNFIEAICAAREAATSASRLSLVPTYGAAVRSAWASPARAASGAL